MEKENYLDKIKRIVNWILGILMTVCLIAIPIIAFAGLWLNYGLVWALFISFSISLIIVVIMRLIGFFIREITLPCFGGVKVKI